MKFNINAQGVYSSSIVKKMAQSSEILETIVNSEEFKQEILNMPDKYKRGEKSKWKDASNIAIYNHIMRGKEEWNDEVDHEADIIVNEYRGRRWSKVIGYMNPGKPTIHLNNRYYYTLNIKKVVSNLLHEWGHTIGFRHGQGVLFRSSIPYYLNKVVEKLYKTLIEGKVEVPEEDVKWKRVCRRKWYRFGAKKCYWVKA